MVSTGLGSLEMDVYTRSVPTICCDYKLPLQLIFLYVYGCCRSL